jgi:precorrin-4/cobalt-precorrin-4 C11-methyltransferase
LQNLTPFYGADCPAAIVARATWPDELVLRGTLADITAQHAASPVERTALIIVGPALAAVNFRDSALYETGYDRRFRPTRAGSLKEGQGG